MGRLIPDTDALNMLKAIGVNELATYTPKGGASISGLYVVFNEEYQEASSFEQHQADYDPMALGLASDFTGAVKGGTLLVRGTIYTILAPQPDGEGFIEMKLSEVVS